MELTLVPTLTHWQYLATIRYLHGDYDGAIVAADRAQDGLLNMPALRAAALCQLGRKDEARLDVARFYTNIREAWTGGGSPAEAEIGRWLLHLYPFSHEAVWRRLRDGIALTGIPVAGLIYHG